MSCAELLLWAWLAFHQHTQNDGTIITVNASDALTAPVLDAELLDHVGAWIQADLPDRTPQASPVAVQQQLIAQQQMLPTLGAIQQAAAATMNQPKRKTVAEAFPTFLPMLLKYCGAADESTLPPIYNQMANCKKSEQVALVQFNMSTRADHVGWAPPIASHAVYLPGCRQLDGGNQRIPYYPVERQPGGRSTRAAERMVGT